MLVEADVDRWHALCSMRSVTGFMTNDENIAEAGTRSHPVVERQSEIFPRSVAAILRALRQSMRAAGRGEAQRKVGRDRRLTIAPVEVAPTLEEAELLLAP